MDRYQKDCLRTASLPNPLCPQEDQRKALGRIFHQMEEVSEAADVLKKHVFYGKPADLSSFQEGPEHTPENTKVIHALLGIQSEIREVLDGLRRGDLVTIKEDFGDMLWYIADGLTGIDCAMSEAMALNLAKLKVRYPERFQEDLAIHKDSARERAVLEGAEDLDTDVSQ